MVAKSFPRAAGIFLAMTLVAVATAWGTAVRSSPSQTARGVSALARDPASVPSAMELERMAYFPEN